MKTGEPPDDSSERRRPGKGGQTVCPAFPNFRCEMGSAMVLSLQCFMAVGYELIRKKFLEISGYPAVAQLLRRSRKVAGIGGGRTATNKNCIVSRLDNPLPVDVVERKLREAQGKVNCQRLARVEGNSSKTLEIAHRLRGAGASNI